MPAQRLELGFLSFVPNPYGPAGAARALGDAIRLFEHAEQLGFDIGWVRVRLFEQFLSSPMTLLAAVAQRTSRIRIGTGVIPLRYEDPIRLAEDAATVDLLSGGRLELGVSSGIGGFAKIFDPVFGETQRGFSDEAQHRLERLRFALAGVAVAHSGAGFMSIPADTDLTVTPAAADSRPTNCRGSRHPAHNVGGRRRGVRRLHSGPQRPNAARRTSPRPGDENAF